MLTEFAATPPARGSAGADNLATNDGSWPRSDAHACHFAGPSLGRCMLHTAVGAIQLAFLAACAPAYDGWRMDRREPELTAADDESISSTIGLRWRVDAGAAVRFSPIIGYGRVFVGTDGNELRALSPITGSSLWTYRAGGKISTGGAVQMLRDIDYPIIWFTAEDGFLYALNAENGTALWNLPGAATTWNSAPGYQVPRHVFYLFGNGISSTLRAVNAVTGAVWWEHSVGNITTATPMVIHSQDVLIQGVTQGGTVVKAYRTTDGTPLWTLSATSPAAGPYTSGTYGSFRDRLYISLESASVEAYNVTNQLRVWRTGLPGGGPVSGLAIKQIPDATDGIVFATQDAHIYALEARTGKILWSAAHSGNQVDPTTRRTPMPAVYGSFVFHVEDGRRLVARRVHDGDVRWNFSLDDTVIGSPAVANGLIVVATKAGTVYGFATCGC